ncbi:MAG TPA: MFS transporter [Roseiarcus sp.]|nr:MFS transporter [Roseiarcus sp.]
MTDLILEKTDAVDQEQGAPGWMTFLLAASCGLLAANLYYAQPLIGLIAPSVGLDAKAASLIVTFTQCGYCAGLALLVPLGDLIENRRLIVTTMCCAALAMGLAAVAPSGSLFLFACLLIGLLSVAAQMLVPIAAHLAPDASRGRMVGNVMSGLLAGIMLARPVSSLIADVLGWRAVFVASAAAIAALAVVMRALLPARRPNADHHYFALIGSLWTLFRETPVLRRRAAYQAFLFAAFSLFWTAVPLELAGPTFGLSQRGIGFFALAGAAGAVSAPIAGRLADRGWSRAVSGLSMAIIAVSFLLAQLGEAGSMAALIAAGLLIDGSVQANQVVGQRAIYALGAEARSRLNGLYVALFFIGGAAGSAIASLVYALGGWRWICWIGFAFPIAGLALFATEFTGKRGKNLSAAARSLSPDQ